jgi:hypothetical protein
MGTLLGFKVYSGGHRTFHLYYRSDAGCREILINRQCPNDAKKIWLVRNLLMFTSRYRAGRTALTGSPKGWQGRNGGRSQLVSLWGLMRYFGRLERMERIQLKQRELERCEARLP